MLTVQQVRLLKEAVDMAETWRGGMLGAASPADIDAFDRKIARMRKALQAAYAAAKHHSREQSRT